MGKKAVEASGVEVDGMASELGFTITLDKPVSLGFTCKGYGEASGTTRGPRVFLHP